MARKRLLIVVLVAAVALVLGGAVGLVLAQGPDGQGEDVSTAGVEAAAVAKSIPVQGRLTDEHGNPINGTRSITFSLYATSSGGSPLCSDNDSVQVANGLFTAYLDGCTSDGIDGKQLYLGIRVGSDAEMTPRQAIYPVPYAYSLRPTAVISGSSAGAIVHVENWATSGRGVRAYAMATTGENFGVVGASRSPQGYGGYFYNNGKGIGLAGIGEGPGTAAAGVWATTTVTNGVALYANASSTDATIVADNQGSGALFEGNGSDGGTAEFVIKNTGAIMSKAHSYVFVPGNVLIKNLSSDTTRWDIQPGGAARVYRGAVAGDKAVYLPIAIPAQLYGQQVTVEGFRVYYRCLDGTKGYITAFNVHKQTDADSVVSLITSDTDMKSNVATSMEFVPTVNNILTANQGTLGMYLVLSFADDVNWVQIGGVRVNFSHHYGY